MGKDASFLGDISKYPLHMRDEIILRARLKQFKEWFYGLFTGDFGKIMEVWDYYCIQTNTHSCDEHTNHISVCNICFTKTMHKFPQACIATKNIKYIIKRIDDESIRKRVLASSPQTQLDDLLNLTDEDQLLLPDRFSILDETGRLVMTASTPKEVIIHERKKPNPDREYLFSKQFRGGSVKLSACPDPEGSLGISFGIAVNGSFAPIPLDMYDLKKLFNATQKAKRRLSKGHHRKKE